MFNVVKKRGNGPFILKTSLRQGSLLKVQDGFLLIAFCKREIFEQMKSLIKFNSEAFANG